MNEIDSLITFKIENIECVKCILNECNQILIYCHGIGTNKLEALPYCKALLDNNIGIVSFDLPCHGDDTLDEFSLSNCLNYLNKVYNYILEEYPNKKISIFGSSFGAYLILNKTKKENNFYKVLLKSTAINFLEAAQLKLEIPDDFFDTNEYLGPFLNIKLYKKDYFEFKNNDLMNDFNKIKDNIYMIHGDEDRTILLENINKFALKYKISLKVINGARHSFKGFEKEVIEFLLDKLK